jgi:glycosyltransferase involved in cell wall biosynthesis
MATDDFQITIPYYANNRESGELYLRRAIDSVVKQTQRNWTLFVVDDRSPIDGVEAFVRSFKDPRITYSRNEKNLGQAGNWNRCMELVDAPHFCILHADDEMKPGYIATMLGYAEQFPDSAAIFCNADTIDQHHAKVFSFVDLVKKGLTSSRVFHLEGDAGLARIMRGNFIICPSVCYHRQLVGDLRFNTANWHTIPDYYFWAHLLLNGRQLTGVPDILFNYRRHSESGTDMVRKGTKIFEEEVGLYEFVEREARSRNMHRAAAVARSKTMIKLRTVYFMLADLRFARFDAARAKLRFFRGI